MLNINDNSSDIIKEKHIHKSLAPLQIQDIEIILNQLKKCVCKIYKNNCNGTGFFCKFNNLNVLVTNNHILNFNDIQNGNKISFSWENGKYKKTITINNSRKVYTSKKDYDTTFIQILENDGIQNFLEIDEEIYEENYENYLNNSNDDLYILNYQDKNNISCSFGKLHELRKYTLSHYCNTKEGSSGSPILSLKTFKVIGIHRGASKNSNYNLGTFIKCPISHFENEIEQNEILLKNNNIGNDFPYEIYRDFQIDS